MICIYCGKNEKEATFKGREHVIPRFFGSFKNNPTIIGRICDNCNSKIFNPLETRFKEDTEEGIYYQMFNFEDSYQIRIRGKNVKTSFASGLENDFFNEIFPFFRHNGTGWKIALLPQIKIKRYGDNGYLVLLIEKLKKIKQNPKKFQEVKNFLEGVQSKDFSIFVGVNDKEDETTLQKAISLVRELGIDYKEKKSAYAPIIKNREFGVSMDCSIGNDAGRIISKIAFNYFIFCAIGSGKEIILSYPAFDKIKSYILGKIDVSIKEIIPAVERETILFDEKIKNVRFIGHTIVFYQRGEDLIAQVSFLGKMTYTVLLAKIPDELKIESFGCGHLFNPINGDILGLTKNRKKWGTGQEIWFGLFNKI